MKLKQILIERDNLTPEEAQDLIDQAIEDLEQLIDSGEYIDDAKFMLDWFSLEPDLFIELLPL